jgi:hypothetical protein
LSLSTCQAESEEVVGFVDIGSTVRVLPGSAAFKVHTQLQVRSAEAINLEVMASNGERKDFIAQLCWKTEKR